MKKVIGIAYMVLFYGFLYLPIVVLVIYSFNDSKYSVEWSGFTWHWYETLFSDANLLQVALNSLILGVLAATIATMLGTMVAVTLYHYRFFGKQLLNGLIFILIVSPDIVMGISLLILFISLNWPLGFWTLLLAHISLCLPFVVVTVLSRISGFDKHLIEASRDLGASEFDTFKKVILPLLMPAIVAGWLLSFTLSLDDVVISFFVTGPDFQILPLKIYSMVRLGIKPEVNALCTLMLCFTLVIATVAHFLQRKQY